MVVSPCYLAMWHAWPRRASGYGRLFRRRLGISQRAKVAGTAHLTAPGHARRGIGGSRRLCKQRTDARAHTGDLRTSACTPSCSSCYSPPALPVPLLPSPPLLCRWCAFLFATMHHVDGCLPPPANQPASQRASRSVSQSVNHCRARPSSHPVSQSFRQW